MSAELTQNAQNAGTESGVERLLSDYKEEVRRRERLSRRWLIIGAIIAGTSWLVRNVLLIGAILHWWGKIPDATRLIFILMQSPVLIGACIGAAVILWQSNPYAEVLAQLDDKRAIGPLLSENLGSTDSRSRTFINALMRLLPQLKASDAGLLSPKEKNSLYHSILPDSPLRLTLNSAELKKYQLIALTAIEQIGDFKALPMLEKLDHSGILSPYIEEAIVRCKIAIEERSERDKLSQTLLRASNNVADNATLLKPAQSGTADETALLRPVI